MTQSVVQKLETAFEWGATDVEASIYAGISKQTLYNYIQENPEFLDRKEALKTKPILLARKSLIEGVQTDPDLALKFLERKRKDEFSLRKEVTGKDGDPIAVKVQGMTTNELEKEVERMRCKLKKL